MKHLAKTLAIVLSLVLLLSLLGGCASPAPADPTTKTDDTAAPAQQAGTPDISEEVTLTMYLIGDRPVDNDLVFEQINARLKEEINATIDVKFMSWSEYEQKYPLIFASGED